MTLIFVRTGELRHAEWREIDEAKAERRIPGEKMKMPSPHIVPRSTQARGRFVNCASAAG